MRKQGIDTIGLVIETDLELDVISTIDGILEDKSRVLTDGRTYIVVKPSEVFSKGSVLSTLSEVEKVIEYIESALGVDKGAIMRIDFSIDTLGELKENEKLYSLYLELLAVERKQEMMYKTVKEVVKTGNLKISNRRVVTTVYDCTDKKRKANTRMEDRYLDLENTYGDKGFSEKLNITVKKHLKEINKLEELIYIVEERYVNILKRQYDEDLKGKEISNFTDFVVSYRKNILTMEMLKQMHEHAGLKGTVKSWLFAYRKTRNLELLKKSDVKGFIGEIKKQYKEILRG